MGSLQDLVKMLGVFQSAWSVVTLCDKHTHTHPFNGPLSRTNRVSRSQKGKTNLDFTGARDIEWQWDQLDHMQVCTLRQTDNHASTHHSVLYRPDALPAAQPTVSKHTYTHKIVLGHYTGQHVFLQCFDTLDWASRRASSLQKSNYEVAKCGVIYSL